MGVSVSEEIIVNMVSRGGARVKLSGAGVVPGYAELRQDGANDKTREAGVGSNAKSGVVPRSIRGNHNKTTREVSSVLIDG